MEQLDYTGGISPSATEALKLSGDFDYTDPPAKIVTGGDGPIPERTLLVSVFINE